MANISETSINRPRTLDSDDAGHPPVRLYRLPVPWRPGVPERRPADYLGQRILSRS